MRPKPEIAGGIPGCGEGNAAVYNHLRQHLARLYPHMQVCPARAATGFACRSRLPLLTQRLIPRRFGWPGNQQP